MKRDGKRTLQLKPIPGLGAKQHSHGAPLALLPDMTCVCFGLSHRFPAPGLPFGGSALKAGSETETGNTEWGPASLGSEGGWPHLPTCLEERSPTRTRKTSLSSLKLQSYQMIPSPLSHPKFLTYPANQHLEGHLSNACPCHQHCGRTAYAKEKDLV